MTVAGNLKVLGLVLLTVCVVGAIGAQGAVAEYEFHSNRERTVLTGKSAGGLSLSFGKSTIECTTAQFEATQTGVKVESKQTGAKVSAETYKSDTLTVAPHLSGCSFSGQSATVNFNHCAFVFDSDPTEGNSDGGEHANMEIECVEGGRIEIDTPLCTLTIGAQVVKHAVRYSSDTESSINFKITGKSIVIGKEKTTESQTGCFLVSTGAILSLTGTTTYECFKDESGEPLSGTSTTTPTELTKEGEAAKCSVETVPAPPSGNPGSIATGEDEGNEKFSFGAAGITECTTSRLEGAVTEGEEAEELVALTVKPTSSGCTFAGSPATVKTNHCAYLLGKSTNAEGHADLEIECLTSSKIEIDTSVCTITIGPQLVKGAVHYEKDTATSFKAKITAKKIKTGKLKTTEPQTGCALFPTGEIGTLTVNHTIGCFDDTAASPQKNPTTPQGTEEGEAVECAFEGS